MRITDQYKVIIVTSRIRVNLILILLLQLSYDDAFSVLTENDMDLNDFRVCLSQNY